MESENNIHHERDGGEYLKQVRIGRQSSMTSAFASFREKKPDRRLLFRSGRSGIQPDGPSEIVEISARYKTLCAKRPHAPFSLFRASERQAGMPS